MVPALSLRSVRLPRLRDAITISVTTIGAISKKPHEWGAARTAALFQANDDALKTGENASFCVDRMYTKK